MTHSLPIAVLGAGSWGTALAIHLARNHQTVNLWGHDVAQMQVLQTARCNQKYLPGINFPEQLHAQIQLADALKNVADILIVVPSHAFRELLQQIKPFITSQTRIVWATKGLDPQKHQLLHELVTEVLGDIPMAILSGPNFAKEIANNLPAATTIATANKVFAKDLVERFHSKTFRVYTSSDVIGVELGSAMKNVLAIAVGIADGMGLGANARAALITRGLAEMMRLGLALGGKSETFMGLSGVGDLVLTCTDNQSRNRRLGVALGSGQSRDVAEKAIGQVVEGIRTAKEIYFLAKNTNIEVPICEQVYGVIYENISPQVAVNNLLSREPKQE